MSANPPAQRMTRSVVRGRPIPWIGSLAVHAVILLLLGWQFLDDVFPRFENTTTTQLAWSEIEEFHGLQLSSDPMPTSVASFTTGGTSTPESRAAALQSEPTVPSVAEIDPVGDAQLAAQETLVATSTVMDAYYGTVAGTFSGGLGDGDGVGDGSGDNFFGPPGDSSTFVFVLDRSGSMSSLHSQAEQFTRFQRLQLELIKFIRQLQPSQRFYVIFFNEFPEPMPTPTMVPATDNNKAMYLEWVARLRPEGMTDPRASLRLAMKLQPDQIYFLSDGDLSDLHRNQVLRLKPGRWKLNTFTFGSRFAEFMKALADIHNGNYTMIR